MIRETWCENESCKLFREPVEHFYHASDKEDLPCEACGGQMARLISGFAAPWTGNLDRFIDPNCDTKHNMAGGGHWQWRVKSSRLVDGSPERMLIENRQQQKDFCKAEGLEDPFDINPNYGTEENCQGMQSSSRLRGSWV